MRRQRFEDSLRRLAPAGGLAPEQVEALWRHYELLERWNARINLTRVIELEEAVRFHYGESLFVAAHLPEGIRTVADVGSGAGFPGFVLAVARPELEVTLIESDQRKAAFLREASDIAPNVRVLAKRSREVSGQFDVAVSRAVKAEDVVRFARMCCRWVLLVGTEPPPKAEDLSWSATALPDGRGALWSALLPEAGAGAARRAEPSA